MTIKSFGLASAMVLGLMVFAVVGANAQNRPYDRDDDRYGNQNQQDDRYNNGQDDRYNGRDRNGNQSYRYAFNKGRQEGLRQGMRDARNRNRGNGGYYGNNGGYGNNQGYGNNNGGILGQIFGQRNNGNNGNNQQAYQRGYQQGYREGLSRGRNNNGRRNNNGGYYGN